MPNAPDESPVRADPNEKFWGTAFPLILAAAYFLIGVFFMRSTMAEPDAFRAGVSAVLYIEQGVYSSYWYHPLMMYVFVAATRLALAFEWDQTIVLNTLAVIFGSLSVWPFYQLARRMLNRQTAAFASVAFIFAPVFIRFSTYLTHEVMGFAFALWSLFLLERTLARQGRVLAVAFGFFCGATWTARPNSAMFIAAPLLLLLFHGARGLRPAAVMRLLLFALLGFVGCMAAIYRPALVAHLSSKFDSFFFVFYDFGLFLKTTTWTVLITLTPVLVALAAIGTGVLLARRKVFVAAFAASWLLSAYIFYIGMYCRDRYFLVMLPSCLLLCFAGADEIDTGLAWFKKQSFHPAKSIALLLLLAVSFGPSLPELFFLRKANNDEIAARMIGEIVGSDLLFTSSFEPIVHYYNREKPPETVYLIREHSPGKITVDFDGINLARQRLKEGRPVFATGEIIRNLEVTGITLTCQLAGEHKTLQLFRITDVQINKEGIVGFTPH